MKTSRDTTGATQVEVAAAGGPSTTTQTKLEDGTGPTPSTVVLKRIDAAFKWEPGTARRILREGGGPTPRGFERSSDLDDALVVSNLANILPIGGPLRRLIHIQEQLDLVIRELRDAK